MFENRSREREFVRVFDVIKFKWAAFGGGKKSGLEGTAGSGNVILSTSRLHSGGVWEFGLQRRGLIGFKAKK